MPTKSNNTGGVGGKRPGAGRKPKGVAEKAANGNPGGRKLTVLDIPDTEGMQMPPPDEILSATQKDGTKLKAAEIYERVWNWLDRLGATAYITPEVIEQYAMCRARWLQCEDMTNELGFLSRNPTTGKPITSPFINIGINYMNQAARQWDAIMQTVKENCSVDFTGANPNDDLEKILHPEEAEIVREIYRRVAAGETMGSIARDMNSRGIDRPFGGKWSTQSIRTLIANEKYLGNALLQKTFVNNHLEKKKVCNNGELPQYYAEGTHDAIVDPELFEAANKVLRGLAEKIGHKTVSHDAFTGLIRCTDCGMNYKRITVHGKIKYACRTFVEKGKARCPSKAVPIETLQSEAAAVLGLPEFNEEVFSLEIARIDIPAHNHLVFVFNDGHTVERVWKDRSRSQSWTPEMKEAARQRAIKQRREKKCQEQ